MGMENRDYAKLKTEALKKTAIDEVIDSVKEYEEQKERLKAHIQKVITEGSDSENLTEKYFNDSIIQNPTNNYFTKKIDDIEKEIAKLKNKFNDLSKQ